MTRVTSVPIRKLLGAVLMLGGVGALALVTPASSAAPTDATYGVSRVDGDPGIAIHWGLCDGQAARTVDLEGYTGGSELGTAVPVYWQVRAHGAPARGARVETYVVGDTPDRFYETVPLRRALPADLVVISGPPGEASTGGMSFQPNELRRDAVYRGGYEFVSPERFAADAVAHCGTGAHSPLPLLALFAFGLGGALVAGRRRPVALFLAVMVMTVPIAAALEPVISLREVLIPQQDRAAFAAGSTDVPNGREVLLELSPTTSLPRDGGVYVGRVVAPSSFAFAVSCEGPSIQVGDASAIEDGATGSRQLIGCATNALVRGAIADRDDREDLVDIVVDPNGMTEWRVIVVSGTGDAGPFREE